MAYLRSFVLANLLCFSLGAVALYRIDASLTVFLATPLLLLSVIFMRAYRRMVDLQRDMDALILLGRAGLKIIGELDAGKLPDVIVSAVAESLQASGALWCLPDEEEKTLEVAASYRNGAKPITLRQLPLLPFRKAFVDGNPLIFNGFADVRLRLPEGLPAVRSLLVFPFKVGERTRALMVIIGDGGRRDFDDRDLRFLSALSGYIRMAIQNAELYAELKEAQEQLAHSERLSALGEIVPGLAHQLNNSLTVINGYTWLLLKSRGLRGEVEDKLRKILSEIGRSKRIVENLSSFARKRRIEREVVSINALLERVVSLRQYDMRANNIAVEQQFQPNLPLTLANPYHMQQVFINIINNACHAMYDAHHRGRLQIKTYAHNGYIVVEFIDDGPGIKEPDKIFNLFYTTKAGKGTGLGLNICCSIMRDHGGQILAENVQPRGAKFTLRIPIFLPIFLERPDLSDEAKLDTIKEIDMETASRARRRSILVVDDKPELLDLEKEILQQHSYNVITASNAVEALNILKGGDIDLIISELKMPGGISGAVLYDWLRENSQGKERPIVFITGDTAGAETARFLTRNHVRYLAKPFNIEDYLTVINEALSA